MSFGSLGDRMKEAVQEKVSGATNAAEVISAASLDKLYEWLDEFNNAMILLGDFGFTLEKFTVGSGLVPSVTTSIVGSLDEVDTEVVDRTIAENQERKIIATLMKSIRTAKNIRDRVSTLTFSDVRIDITLGWPPDISLDFIDSK